LRFRAGSASNSRLRGQFGEAFMLSTALGSRFL
jgi:hypothetical protein